MTHLKHVEFENKDRITNVSDFAALLSSPGIIKMINALSQSPMSYSEIHENVFGYSSAKSNCDYHLRRCKGLNILHLDRDKKYYLTFRGQKLHELIACLDKIANLDNSAPENALTKLEIRISSSKTWLEPFIESQVEKIISNMRFRK